MLEFDVCVLTHPGKVRGNNEDSVTLVRPGSRSQADSLLAVVADGMGGHEGGEVASRIAVEILERAWASRSTKPAAALQAALAAANRAIFRRAEQNPGLTGMGTTCVALAVFGNQATWGWIGDSRLYLLREGRAYRLSEDHTVVQQMLRRGLITAEEARRHPDHSVLERALGTRKSVEPGLACEPMPIRPGDRMLLCSDGLHDLVEDSEMAATCDHGPSSESANQLLNLALERGGHDNISLIVISAAASNARKRPPRKTREHSLA